MKNHYFKSKVIKMGIWALLPGDIETWHGEYTNAYFKKLFGIGKGILLLNDTKEGYSNAYTTEQYFKDLYNRINVINKRDFRSLEKKLKTFYKLLPKARKEVASKTKSLKKLSNKELAKEFFRIRDWIHHLAIYDQFSWLAEEYWMPKMEEVLVSKLGLQKGSDEYNKILFALTKPEEISSTLLEKQTVLEKGIKIKNKKISLLAAAKQITKQFGWLPVFCFGEPWHQQHYEEELRQITKRPLSQLKRESLSLKKYRHIRNRDINKIVEQYKIDKKDLQIFIDFGLAIDTRNEAEYFVSFGGFYLLPLYHEIAKRLFLSVKQVRLLFEKEMLDALEGKVQVHKILAQRHHWGSWGFNKKLTKRINFTHAESEKLFTYIESYVKPVQGSDNNAGLCASPGKVTGIARIVPYPSDCNKVKQGDILITYATTTDYLPAMKRAGGIITEVGGLTCHAAVVSREFGIPCIVALKGCMKNIPDGKMIEVDANIGTVKKIT